MKAKTIAYICNHKDGRVKLFMEEPESPMWESSDLVLRHEAQAEIDALKADLAASITVHEEMQLGGNRLAESLRFARDEIDALRAENAELTSALSVIHELAHNESTGPVFEDGYWAIRALAGEALGVK